MNPDQNRPIVASLNVPGIGRQGGHGVELVVVGDRFAGAVFCPKTTTNSRSIVGLSSLGRVQKRGQAPRRDVCSGYCGCSARSQSPFPNPAPGLERQKPPLSGDPPWGRISAEPAARRHHSVAGYHKRDSIAGHAVSDRPGSPGATCPGGQLCVTDCSAVWYLPAFVEDCSPKLAGWAQVDTNVAEVVGRACGIGMKPCDQLRNLPVERGIAGVGSQARRLGILYRGPGGRRRRMAEREPAERPSGNKNAHPPQFAGEYDARLGLHWRTYGRLGVEYGRRHTAIILGRLNVNNPPTYAPDPTGGVRGPLTGRGSGPYT
jgi:hypothetical protein